MIDDIRGDKADLSWPIPRTESGTLQDVIFELQIVRLSPYTNTENPAADAMLDPRFVNSSVKYEPTPHEYLPHEQDEDSDAYFKYGVHTDMHALENVI